MKSAFFPSIRGSIGDWVYYCSTMPISEVAKRVSFINDIHKRSNVFSDMIQREIDHERITQIASYLSKNKQRFFNSLVLAVYNGTPLWHPAKIESSYEKKLIDTNNRCDVGLLEFSGSESIIPIDGQHRLAGIKEYVLNCSNYEQNQTDNFPVINDIIPVIFVAHRTDTEENLFRTRRLFTTLNKYAESVSKQEIIAIDEDDPVAITTRWLVENDNRFSDNRIAIKTGSNISLTDGCLTSVENIYDVLVILYMKVLRRIKDHTQLNSMRRPEDEVLNSYLESALEFFECLECLSKELSHFFKLPKFEDYARQQRAQGNLLFRPVGLKLIVNLLAKMDGISISEKFTQLKGIPLNLNDMPYRNLLITEQGKMLDSNEPKVRKILLACLGINLKKHEILTAKDGISIITGRSKSEIASYELPTCLNDLNKIEDFIA